MHYKQIDFQFSNIQMCIQFVWIDLIRMWNLDQSSQNGKVMLLRTTRKEYPACEKIVTGGPEMETR